MRYSLKVLVVVRDENQAVLPAVRIYDRIRGTAQHDLAQALNGVSGIPQEVTDRIFHIFVGEKGN